MTGHGDLIQAAIIIIILLVPMVTVWVWMLCSAIHGLTDAVEGWRQDQRRRHVLRRLRGR